MRDRFALLIVLALAIPCFAQTHPAAANTVIWLSIDGFRHDYIERFHPPTLTKLAAEGAFTNQEKPIFPSLTFPNHTAQVTGTTVDHHGIVMNGWYDSKLHESFSFPDHPEFIRTEPIWLTAERQGVPTAVVDWPMSTAQQGLLTADFFDPGFDSKETDIHRLNRVIELLNTHHLPPATTEPAATQPTSNYHGPPRLILSYLSEVDHIGHRDGPESAEIKDAVLETDGVLKIFADKAVDWFQRTHGPDEELYLIVSTDHGMETTTTQVNLDRLIGTDLMSGLKIVTSGPMACVYLVSVPAEERAAKIADIQAKLAAVPFAKDWAAGKLPEKYHYTDADRAGDLIVMLDSGYTFTSNRDAATKPIGERGPHGMHGYDPDTSPDLLGSAIIWRLRHPIGGKDLGPIDNTQWHATVAHLLGIQPSDAAEPSVVWADR